MDSPSPAQLWQQAGQEHPDDPAAYRQRYRELMREHGLIVPGKAHPLPCGWPKRETDGQA